MQNKLPGVPETILKHRKRQAENSANRAIIKGRERRDQVKDKKKGFQA